MLVQPHHQRWFSFIEWVLYPVCSQVESGIKAEVKRTEGQMTPKSYDKTTKGGGHLGGSVG